MALPEQLKISQCSIVAYVSIKEVHVTLMQLQLLHCTLANNAQYAPAIAHYVSLDTDTLIANYTATVYYASLHVLEVHEKEEVCTVANGQYTSSSPLY